MSPSCKHFTDTKDGFFDVFVGAGNEISVKIAIDLGTSDKYVDLDKAALRLSECELSLTQRTTN